MPAFMVVTDFGGGAADARRFPDWFSASVEVARLCPGVVAPDGGLLRPRRVGDGTRTFFGRHGTRLWVDAVPNRLSARAHLRSTYGVEG